jgi:hypothetical protein
MGRDQTENPWGKLRKPQGPIKEAQNENVHFGRIMVTRKLGKCQQNRHRANFDPALAL